MPRPVTMETRCCQKYVRISKTPDKRFMYRSLWAQTIEKNVSHVSKTPKKNTFWADLGRRNLRQKFISSGEILGPRQNSIDKANDCAIKSEGGALLRAPTHPLLTVFTKRPVICDGRRPGVWSKHIWVLLCRKQATKFLDPSPTAKKILYFRFERRV